MRESEITGDWREGETDAVVGENNREARMESQLEGTRIMEEKREVFLKS